MQRYYILNILLHTIYYSYVLLFLQLNNNIALRECTLITEQQIINDRISQLLPPFFYTLSIYTIIKVIRLCVYLNAGDLKGELIIPPLAIFVYYYLT